MRLPPLYPIVNVVGEEPQAGRQAFELALELAGAGASLIQLRAKSLGAGSFTDLATELREALASSATRLVVNDRLDVALAAEAQGVHLGDEDLPVAAARRLLATAPPTPRPPGGAEPFVIGYSTHSVDEAAQAAGQAADYLGFGPVFESPTKAGVRKARGLELLAGACRASRLPVVAIGGVTLENARECWKAGAASVAVISEIEGARDRRALLDSYRRAAAESGLAHLAP